MSLLKPIVIRSLGRFYSGQTDKIILSDKIIKELEHNIWNTCEGTVSAHDQLIDSSIRFLVGIISSNIKKEEIIDYIISGEQHKITDLLLFKDLKPLLSCNNPIKVVNYIIKNNIKGFTFNGKKVSFKDLEQEFSPCYFENWDGEISIKGGSALVKLCDYLKIKVKPLCNSPRIWDIEEYSFEEYSGSKQDLINFSRLFKKPMKEWYAQYPHWSEKYT